VETLPPEFFSNRLGQADRTTDEERGLNSKLGLSDYYLLPIRYQLCNETLYVNKTLNVHKDPEWFCKFITFFDELSM
jgi:hypothetical protein